MEVQNDVLSALDQVCSVIVLVVLHLSAAFDTIEHAFLFSRLREKYGIHDQAFVWISSYLSDRLQRVNIKGTLSDTQNLSFGVPQGSVLLRLKSSCSSRIVTLKRLLERVYRSAVLQSRFVQKLKSWSYT